MQSLQNRNPLRHVFMKYLQGLIWRKIFHLNRKTSILILGRPGTNSTVRLEQKIKAHSDTTVAQTSPLKIKELRPSPVAHVLHRADYFLAHLGAAARTAPHLGVGASICRRAATARPDSPSCS